MVKAGAWLAIVAIAGVNACGSGQPSGATAGDCRPPPPGTRTGNLALRRVATGFARPVDLAPFPGAGRRWLIATQDGAIRLASESGSDSEFLDLRSAVTVDHDSGLLAVALDPHFPADSRVFVRYSIDSPRQTVLDEFRVPPDDPTRVDTASGRRLVAIGRDTLGHDGGSILFGPDGFLYVTVGDGGPLGDPKRKAQDLGKLSGKVLRLDVDNGDPYRIPDSNPFVAKPGARAEIWASGFRNPWRASFDRENGDLWIADVGENEREEIDRVEGGSAGGLNFGWSRFEGTKCFDATAGCDSTGLTPPALEYEHMEPGGAPQGGPCAVVGGPVYRGCAIPELRGAYFYGDFCAGFVKSIHYRDGAITDEHDWSDSFRRSGLDSVSAFAADTDGELYVVDYADGDVFRIVAEGS